MRVRPRDVGVAGLLVAVLWAGPAAGQTPEEAVPPPAPEEEADLRDEAAAEAAALQRAGEAVQAARDAAEAARDAATAARDALTALGAVPAVIPAAPVEAAGPPTWSGQATASLISLTGNANTVTAALAATLTGEWRGWATQFTGTGSYGQTRPEDTAEADVTALDGELRVRGERKFSEVLAAYVSAGVATDHVASIEVRAYGEPGVSVTWLERVEGDLVRSRVRTDVGFRVAQEERFQYYPVATDLADLTLYQIRAAAEFRYALSRTTVFSQTVEALEDLSNTDDFRLNAATVMSARVIDGLALQVAFEVRHNGNPAPGKVQTDTRLAAGITVGF